MYCKPLPNDPLNVNHVYHPDQLRTDPEYWTLWKITPNHRRVLYRVIWLSDWARSYPRGFQQRLEEEILELIIVSSRLKARRDT